MAARPNTPKPAGKPRPKASSPRTEARQLLGRLSGGAKPSEDEIADLKQLAGDAVTLTNSLRDELAKLRRIRSTDKQGKEQVDARLTVYLEAIKQTENILSRIVLLDLDARAVVIAERRVAIEDEVAHQVVDALHAALDLASGLTNRRDVERELLRHLRIEGTKQLLPPPKENK